MGNSQTKQQVGRKHPQKEYQLSQRKKMLYLALHMWYFLWHMLAVEPQGIFFFCFFFLSCLVHWIEGWKGECRWKQFKLTLRGTIGQYEHQCFWMIFSSRFHHGICAKCLRRLHIPWVNHAVASPTHARLRSSAQKTPND